MADKFAPKSTQELYAKLASLVLARANCEKSGNAEWREKHTENAEDIAREFLPSGSGFDTGTKINWELSDATRLVFDTAFHHMDDNGFYCGWTKHRVTIRAHLAHGFTVSVSGRNYRDIKDRIADLFYSFC